MHFAGDAVLADFSTVKDALSCAVDAQQDIKIRNQDFSDDNKLEFRIGVNIGDVIVDRNDLQLRDAEVASQLMDDDQECKIVFLTMAGNEMVVYHSQRMDDVTPPDLVKAICVAQSKLIS